MKTELFQELLKGSTENNLGYIDVNDLESHARDAGIKHNTILDYPLNIYTSYNEIGSVFDHELEQSVDVTVCYAVWRTPLYIKYLYLSLLSQLLYTDLLKVEQVYIITDSYLEPIVWEIFRPFTELENFNFEIKTIDSHALVESHVASDVLTPRRINKYIISFLDEIRQTDLLLISDSESFPYGKPKTVYSDIYEKYKNEEENFPVIACREYDEYSVFLERRENLATMMASDMEYVNWFCRRLGVGKKEFINQMIKKEDWYLTCWFLYDNTKFSIKDEDWKDFVEWCRLYGFYCDESVYLSYGRCNKNYDFEDLNYIDGLEFIYSKRCKSFYEQKNYDKLGVMHPLHGKYSDKDWVTSFYDSIQMEFDKLLANTLNTDSTIKDNLPQYN